MKKTHKILISVLSVLIIGGGIYYWYTNYKVPHDKAVTEFNSAKKVISQKNKNLDTEIDDSKKILGSKDKPFKQDTFTQLQVSITDAQKTKRNIPSLPKKTKDINEATEALNKPLDYSKVINNLKEKKKIALNSIAQQKQITNPKESFVIDKLKRVEKVKDIQAATEDNDPNDSLNKQGGYTSAVYFSSSDINQDEIFGKSLLDKGTESGGSIEVYKTVEDAKKRNEYLSSFDGTGILSPGAHSILGTIVIRISDKLTATQQKDLESQIINQLLTLE